MCMYYFIPGFEDKCWNGVDVTTAANKMSIFWYQE